MKKPYKILLFVISLTGFGFSAGILTLFYSTSSVMDTIILWRDLYPWFNIAFAGYIASICLCFFMLMLIALFLPGKPRDLSLQQDRGKLLFSRHTVESTVRYSFADVEGINFCKVRVKLGGHPDKIRIYVKLSVNDTTRLVGLTQTIQERIDSSLKSSLFITAQAIDIKVAELAVPAEKKESEVGIVKSGRVE